MVVQMNSPFSIKGIDANKINEAYIRVIGEKDVINAKKISVNKNGEFKIDFDGIDGSYKPYRITIKNDDDSLTLGPIYFGDVYLMLGQSNMAYVLSAVEQADKYIKAVDYQDIYILNILESADSADPYFITRPEQPQKEISNKFKWEKLTSHNADHISALSTMFASLMAKDVSYPIGIIHTSMGGLSIETYLAKKDVDKQLELVNMMKQIGVYYNSKSEYNKAGGRNFTQLSGVFNEKIAPLKDILLKGVIFYLGESACYDDDRAKYYLLASRLLVNSYRSYFKQNDLPFIFTHIADCYYPYGNNLGYNLINEAMNNIDLPHVYIVPTYDIVSRWMNEKDDAIYYHPIHPRNKEPIAKRYYKIFATNLINHQDYHFPKIDNYVIKNDCIIANIKAYESKFAINNYYFGFAIAGKDKKYYPAEAKSISEYQICISSKYVNKPKYFNYAFFQSNNSADATLINNDPIMPYSSDKVNASSGVLLFDQMLTSCSFLTIDKEDNFGYEIGGGFKHNLFDKGEIINSNIKINLANKNKNYLERHIVINYFPSKKDNYYYFGVKCNFGLSGLKHQLANYKYLNIDLKANEAIEFHGALFRINGLIKRFPVVNSDGDFIPFAILDNQFKTFALDLCHVNDGSEALWNANKQEINNIVGLELYFRSKKAVEVAINNIVLCDTLQFVDATKVNDSCANTDASLVIPKNS